MRNLIFKKIIIFFAVVITAISQTNIISAIATIPEQTDEITIAQVVDGKEITKDNSSKINEEITLKISDANKEDEYTAVQLPMNVEYVNEATKQINQTRNDLSLAYNSQDRTIYAHWTKKSTREVNIVIKATRVGDYSIQAKTKRGSREVQSKPITLKAIDTNKLNGDLSKIDNAPISKNVNSANVTVHYKDIDTGKAIAPDETLSGDYNTSWVSSFKDLTSNNYYWQKTDGDGTLDSKKVNASGTFTENKQEVTYWYSLNTDTRVRMLKHAYKFNNVTEKWERWDGQEVKRGDKIRWSNSFTNLDYPNGILTNVSFNDPLPSYVSDATNVKVTESDDINEDILPDDINISTDNHSVHIDGFADMNGQYHYSVTFETTVTQDAPVGVITNTSTANTETVAGEKISARDSADIHVVDPVGDLKAEKSVIKADGSSASDVRIGDELEYTIKTTNTVAGSRVNNVKVTDPMPTGLDLETNTIQVLDNDGNDITSKVTDNSTTTNLDVETLVDLMGSQSVTVKFKAKINDKAEIGKTINNIAHVTGESPNSTDPNPPGSDGDNNTPTPNYNDGKIEGKKTVENTTGSKDVNDVKVGDVLQYTISATNTVKDSIVKDVVVSDDVPSGVDLDRSSIKVYDKDGNDITSKVDITGTGNSITVKGKAGYSIDLKYNESMKVVFDSTVKESSVGKDIENTANIIGQTPDGPTDPSKPSVDVPGVNYNDGKIEGKKTVENTTGSKDVNDVKVGDVLQYTISATNTVKDSIVKDVVVSDDVPSGVDLDRSSIKVYDKDGNDITSKVDITGTGNSITVKGKAGYSIDLKYNESMKVVFDSTVKESSVGKDIENTANIIGQTPDGPTDPSKPSVDVPGVKGSNIIKPNKPGISGNTSNSKKSSVTDNHKKLPKTGENLLEQNLLSMIGLLILSTFSYFNLKSRKKII
ncbi:isopeptide-forming domain-containing fimbrial protein [Companilactobacillus sp. DQM5]|uniref:isopeptide-forming domain-containing fimbrial protein n=1 Tax=Companilactobacillus sp. DQM5 TaxID=3463359 RepID=UPI004058937E